jgi:3-oxoadipate enol-lactonase
MPRIETNGIQIYYELHGPAAAPVLVLSNGVLMSTASWAYQIPDLSRDYRLLLYDCRGMWQSDHPPGPYSMELHADDLAALLDGLDVDQAHIGGTSYGAEISMVFALKYPERTRSLIVTSAVSQVDPILEGFIGGWIAAARAKDPELFYQVVYPLTFSEVWIAANRALLDQARERYKTIDFEAMLALLLSFSELDITDQLHQIRAPTMVDVGELDMLKPRRYSEIIAGEIPGAELGLIPNAGHATLWEQAGVFNTLILGFLARQGGRRLEGRKQTE